jgi:hypothetical protein
MTVRGLQIGAAVVCGALVLAPAARAVEQAAVNQAVARGVAYLKNIQGTDGSWHYGLTDATGLSSNVNTVGATALAALTLLECGVPIDDPAVQKAAAYVRQACPTLTKTYCLALGIMFFDRLGDARDADLIESMAVRLLAGQNTTSGGWTYECPALSADEVNRLKQLLQQRNELKTGELPKAGSRREAKDLPKEIQQQLEQVGRAQAAGQAGVGGQNPDNSNTQFAILALWIARRQGIPVDTSLQRIDARFRASQNQDGGWSYNPSTLPNVPHFPGGRIMPSAAMGGMGSTPAMTCAGLLGLALSHGGAAEAVLRTQQKEPGRENKTKRPPEPNRDAAVKAGLAALGTCIGRPGQKDNDPTKNPEVQGPNGNPVVGPPIARNNGRGYYFLWSVERVAVAYGLDSIGGKDWYGWGAEILLGNQHADGSWIGQYSEGGVDTCFALLFLVRANMATDLTDLLKGKTELRAVGSDDVEKKPGLKPAFEDKPDPRGDKGKPAEPGTEKADTETGRLSAELVNAPEEKRDEVLKKLRDSKGGEYSDALADAIPKLSGEMKTKARDALAERMSRMTAGTLKDKLRDDDLEIRRAAALAVAMKEEKSLVPRLIELLDDSEQPVARAAHAALRNLTGQDFGPAADAGRDERAQAIAAWKDWWAKQGDK